MNFASAAGDQILIDPQKPIIDGIFSQYERVIIESLVTSFGLDFLAKDQHGGDVDTIHNVRLVGVDKELKYKNEANKDKYEKEPKYNDVIETVGRSNKPIKAKVEKTYHDLNKNYGDKKGKTRNKSKENMEPIEDAYTGDNIFFLGKAKGANPKLNAELDHTISAKWIHDDPGRVLADLNGPELANSDENLNFTNKSLNASMGAMEIPEYVEKHPELPDETKKRMLKAYNKAKKAYEHKLFVAYYTSSNFLKDTGIAAGKVGINMGLRQALGFVFAEIWFSGIKPKFAKVGNGFSLEEFLIEISDGIKNGIIQAQKKYKSIFEKFGEGLIAGALGSITTTLCNIFFTTAKNVIRIVRQTWASIVEAIKILLFNPDGLPMGDQIRAAVKVIAMGASIVAGTLISEFISKSPLGTIPVAGDIIITFCGTLVTGILSCTLLYVLDRSEYVQKIVDFLNSIPNVDHVVEFYKKQAVYFEEYAAKIANIDIDKFKREVNVYQNIAINVGSAQSDSQLLDYLNSIYDNLCLNRPWQGDFDDFMSNKNNRLVFK